MTKVKGATHYDSKVVQKLATGGAVTSQAAGRMSKARREQGEASQKIADRFQSQALSSAMPGLDGTVTGAPAKYSGGQKKSAADAVMNDAYGKTGDMKVGTARLAADRKQDKEGRR